MRPYPTIVLAPPPADRERFEQLRARFAAEGHQLQLGHRRRTYAATIWTRMIDVESLDAAERLLQETAAARVTVHARTR